MARPFLFVLSEALLVVGLSVLVAFPEPMKSYLDFPLFAAAIIGFAVDYRQRKVAA